MIVYLKLGKDSDIAVEMGGKVVMRCSTLEQAKNSCEKLGWTIHKSSIGLGQKRQNRKIPLWKGN